MKKNKIKTLDVAAMEWFDRVNGNSYFSVRVTINFGQPTEEKLYVPFQYGYGEQYEFVALDAVVKSGHLKTDTTQLSRACRELGITLRSYKTAGLKKVVRAWGEPFKAVKP
jgi:hypothetical protein